MHLVYKKSRYSHNHRHTHTNAYNNTLRRKVKLNLHLHFWHTSSGRNIRYSPKGIIRKINPKHEFLVNVREGLSRKQRILLLWIIMMMISRIVVRCIRQTAEIYKCLRCSQNLVTVIKSKH